MKKSLVALAVLGTLAGTAAAQSSVTVFGVLDVNVRYNKANGQTLWSESTDGNQSSRLGFRGVEDLGGGMKASFWLESALSADAGTGGNTGASPNKFFDRRATVSLSGDFGEVRLGRSKTGERTILDDFDPFGTIGVGNVMNTYSTLGSGLNTNTTWNRSDNQIAYILPGNLGGFYGQIDVAPSEGAATVNNKYYGGRFGYKQGPLNVTAGLSSNYGAPGVAKYTMGTLAGSYDFEVVQAQAFYSQTKFGSRKQSLITLAALVPVGQGQFKIAYTMNNANNTAEGAGFYDSKLLAAGYVYNLSKRSALYTTVAKLTNDGKGKQVVNGSPAAAAGGNSGGFEVGMRHSF